MWIQCHKGDNRYILWALCIFPIFENKSAEKLYQQLMWHGNLWLKKVRFSWEKRRSVILSILWFWINGRTKNGDSESEFRVVFVEIDSGSLEKIPIFHYIIRLIRPHSTILYLPLWVSIHIEDFLFYVRIVLMPNSFWKKKTIENRNPMQLLSYWTSQTSIYKWQ